MSAHQALEVDGPSRTTVVSATIDDEARRLVVEWGDGHVSRYPFIWLRHYRFFPAMGRSDQPDGVPHLIPEDPETPEIGKLALLGARIEINWSHDGSSTSHNLIDLRRDCISETEREKRRPKAITWDCEQASNLRWFDASDLDEPEGLLAVFEHLLLYGIVFVRNVPAIPGTVVEIGKRFGPIRRSHFGELFDIRSTPEDNVGAGANIGATTFTAQAPHVDDGFRHGIIGINFFHSLEAHELGQGRSVFVDGFRVAEAVRQSDPGAFSFLSTVPLQFTAERNPDERFRTKRRMIATDSDGVIRGICVSDRTFPPMNLPESQIEPAYRSLRAFCRELRKEEMTYKVLLNKGDLAIFDNHRVLHARTEFDPSICVRHLQQVSVDREEFHNRMRQLAEQCGRWDLANLDTDAGVLSQR